MRNPATYKHVFFTVRFTENERALLRQLSDVYETSDGEAVRRLVNDAAKSLQNVEVGHERH